MKMLHRLPELLLLALAVRVEMAGLAVRRREPKDRVAHAAERELGILVSRLHSNHLDLSRPPWEIHGGRSISCGARCAALSSDQ